MKLIEFSRNTVIDETKTFFGNAQAADEVADTMRGDCYSKDEVGRYKQAAVYISSFGDVIRATFSRLYHDIMRKDPRSSGQFITKDEAVVLEYENAAHDVLGEGIDNRSITYDVRIIRDIVEVHARCLDVDVHCHLNRKYIANGRAFMKYVYDLLETEYNRKYFDTYSVVRTAFAAWIADHVHDIPGVLDIDVAKPLPTLIRAESGYSAWEYPRMVTICDIDGNHLISVDLSTTIEDRAAYDIVIKELDKALEKGKAAAKAKKEMTLASFKNGGSIEINSSNPFVDDMWRKQLMQTLNGRIEKDIRERKAARDKCFDRGDRFGTCVRGNDICYCDKIHDVVVVNTKEGRYIKVFWNDGTISGVKYDPLYGEDCIGWAIMARYISQKEVEYTMYRHRHHSPVGLFCVPYNDVKFCSGGRNSERLIASCDTYSLSTVIKWADGSKSSVTCSHDDYEKGLYSRSSGILYAMLKHYRGDDFWKELDRWHDIISERDPDWRGWVL